MKTLRWRPARRDTSIGRILENTAWLLGGKGVGAVLSLLYLAIVTRTLGPEGFGHFALITSTAQAIGILVSFESWQVIVKYGQAHIANQASDRFGRLVRFCLAVDICAALIGCGFAVGVVLLLGNHLDWDAGDRRLAMIYCAVILITVRSAPMGILRLFDRFDTGAAAETMVPVGRMIGAVIAWLTAPSLLSFLIAWAAAEILCAATYWMLALRTARERMGQWDGRNFVRARTENPGILSFLAATSLSISVAGLTRQLSVLIVGFFVGAADAGFYRLGYQLSNSLTKMSSLLARTIFAELARVQARASSREMRKLFKRTRRLSLIVGVVIVAVLLLLGKPVLLLMAGEPFLPAYTLLLILGIAASIDLIGVSYEPLLMAANRARTSVTIKLFNAALLLALLFFLLPRMGTLGGAIAQLVVSVVGFVLMGSAARRFSRSLRDTG
jgi:O-antigen/teichoic acid export membrane protein